jgi:hypothetical protein
MGSNNEFIMGETAVPTNTHIGANEDLRRRRAWRLLSLGAQEPKIKKNTQQQPTEAAIRNGHYLSLL